MRTVNLIPTTGAPAPATSGDVPLIHTRPITWSPDQVESEVRRKAIELGLDPDQVARVSKFESGFKVDATSPVGAYGPMQVMPYPDRGNIRDPRTNIDVGEKLWRDALQKAHGDPDLAYRQYYNPGYKGPGPFAGTPGYAKVSTASAPQPVRTVHLAPVSPAPQQPQQQQQQQPKPQPRPSGAWGWVQQHILQPAEHYGREAVDIITGRNLNPDLTPSDQYRRELDDLTDVVGPLVGGPTVGGEVATEIILRRGGQALSAVAKRFGRTTEQVAEDVAKRAAQRAAEERAAAPSPRPPAPAPRTEHTPPPVAHEVPPRAGQPALPEQKPRTTPANPDLRGDTLPTPGPGTPAAERIAAANRRADSVIQSADNWVKSAGDTGDPSVIAARNRQIGHRDLFNHKSSQFWDSVGADLDQLSTGKMPDTIRTEGPRPRKVNLRGEARKVADETRQAVSLYLDRMRDPAAFDAKIEAAVERYPQLRPIVERMQNLSPEVRAYSVNVINRYDQLRGQFLTERGVLQDARDWHVSHLWEDGAPGGRGVGKRLGSYAMRGERTYETFVDGIAAGKVPKTLDIVQINALNDQSVARATFSRELRDSLIESGEAVWSDRPVAGMVSGGGFTPVFRAGDKSLYLTPDAARAVESYVRYDPYANLPSRMQNFWKGFTAYQDFLKSAKLNLSLFHHANLMRGFLTRGFLPGTLTPIKTGLRWLTEGDPYVDALIRGGLKVDIRSMQATQDSLLDVQRLWGPFRPAARLLRENPLSRYLWNDIHPGLKVYDGVTTLRKVMGKFESRVNPRTGRPWTMDEIAEDVATTMNDRYGGIHFERTKYLNKWLPVMRRVLFAPDWTMSNLRQLWNATGGGGFDIRAAGTLFANTPKGYLARRNFATIIAIGGALDEVLNHALSGHWTWENEPGRKLGYVDTGRKDADGKEIYIFSPFTPASVQFGLNILSSVKGVWDGDWTVYGAFSFLWNRLHPAVRAGVELAASLGGGGRLAGIKSPGAEMRGNEYKAPVPWYETKPVQEITPLPIGGSTYFQFAPKQGFAAIPPAIGLYRTSPSPTPYNTSHQHGLGNLIRRYINIPRMPWEEPAPSESDDWYTPNF